MQQTTSNSTTAINQSINKLVDGINLTFEEMQAAMLNLMQGQLSESMITALLVALRMKGESVDEIYAAASVMRNLAEKVDINDLPYLVDIVGTGGDGANLFNVSTASAFVAAAAGCHVAKHGNRGVSTSSGSSDLLQAANIALDLTPAETERCIREFGVGFLFAPNHHKAMKHVIGVRQQLKMRTIFNMLGPLINPAFVPNLLIGVYDEKLCEPLAHVMNKLGANHVMVVHALDGLDEISLAASTHITELKDGHVNSWQFSPADVGIKTQDLSGLSVTSAKQSLTLINDALGKNKTTLGEKAADMIALNAGAAIYVSGLCADIATGVKLAQDLIYGGQALEKMHTLAEFSKTIIQTR